MSPTRFRISYRVFTAFLVAGLLGLAVAGVFVLGTGQTRLRASYRDHLSQVAEQTTVGIDSYVFRRAIAVSVLARVPDVREEAAAGSRRPVDENAILQVDQEWQQKRIPPASVVGLFAGRASRFLADVTRQDPIYREILVTDRFGRLVAASGTSSDYYQADEDWWKQSFGGGVHGRMAISGVTWDDSSRTWALEISVPIEDPSSDTLAGVLKATMDIREMVAMVSAVRLGDTGEAVLIDDNGSIVLSRRPYDPKARFFAPDLLRERLQVALKAQPQGRLSFAGRDEQGSVRLVGLAFSQLRASYPHLTWLVAVSQAEDELFQPVRVQLWSLTAVLALTAVAVLALALWFSMRLAAPPFVDGLHLVEHSGVSRMGDSA